MTEEDFEAWSENPVTRWVFAACMKAADANKQKWVDSSWEFNHANQALLSELRTRADAYAALVETDFDGWLAWHEGDAE